jgi:hypothetical protein
VVVVADYEIEGYIIGGHPIHIRDEVIECAVIHKRIQLPENLSHVDIAIVSETPYRELKFRIGWTRSNEMYFYDVERVEILKQGMFRALKVYINWDKLVRNGGLEEE